MAKQASILCLGRPGIGTPRPAMRYHTKRFVCNPIGGIVTLAKKGMYVFVGCAIYLLPSFAVPPPDQAWLISAREKEPELADCISGVFKGWPTWEEYEGQTCTELNKAVEKALNDRRASFDSQKQQLLIEKMTSALDAQPPDWEVVGLALRVAYYAKMDPQILQIAEDIVKAPPAVEFGVDLAKEAMRLLASSREQRYYQLIFNCAYDDDYLKTQPFKIEDITSAAVHALTLLPPADTRPFLMKLAQKYPFHPPKVSGFYSVDEPEQRIAMSVSSALSLVNAIQNGVIIDLGSTPRP
jgi:hypothetical protein